MIKYALPSILLGTVLIAGIFALLPVEDASTVHTTILAGTTEIRSVSSAAGGLDLDSIDEIKIECGGQPFIVRALYMSEDATSIVGADDNYEITAVELEGTVSGAATPDMNLGEDRALTATTTNDSDDDVIEFVQELAGANAELRGGLLSRGEAMDFLIQGLNIEVAEARVNVEAVLEVDGNATCTATVTDGAT